MDTQSVVHTYTCTTEKFKDKPIEYRSLTPGDILALEGSVLTLKLTELGYKTQGMTDVDFTDMVSEIPKLEGIEVAVNNARPIVVLAALKPSFSHLPPDSQYDSKISIEELPVDEVLLFAQEIRNVSGVRSAEDRFRDADGEGEVASDAGQPARSEDDPGDESETPCP